MPGRGDVAEGAAAVAHDEARRGGQRAARDLRREPLDHLRARRLRHRLGNGIPAILMDVDPAQLAKATAAVPRFVRLGQMTGGLPRGLRGVPARPPRRAGS